MVTFDIPSKEVILKCFEASENSFKEYLYVGNPSGSEKYDRLTLVLKSPSTLGYIFSKVIYDSHDLISKFLNLGIINKKEHEREIGGLLTIISEIREKFFDSERKALKDGVKISVDPICGEPKSIIFSLPSGKMKQSKLVKEISNKISENLIDLKQFVLVTIAVKNDKDFLVLSKTIGYRYYLYYRFVFVDSRGGSKAEEGTCHVCGSQGTIIVDPYFPGGSLLKIFTLDKLHAFPGLPKDKFKNKKQFAKAFAICPKCYVELFSGLRFIENTLRIKKSEVNWGNVLGDTYLIPHFPTLREYQKFVSATRHVKDEFKALLTFDFLQNLVNGGINDQLDYSLNIIFGSREQQSFDLRGVIVDVPSSRIRSFVEDAYKIYNNFKSILDEGYWAKYRWVITFDNVYRIYPLRIVRSGGREKIFDWSELLDLYRALLGDSTFNYHTLIRRAVLHAKIRIYGVKKSYTVSSYDNWDNNFFELLRSLILYNLLILYLKKNNRLIGVSELSLSSETKELINNLFGTEVTEWVEKVGYDDKKTALFLAGFLMGAVASEQYKHTEGSSVPILNKLSYDGMNKEKVIDFVNILGKYLFQIQKKYWYRDKYSAMLKLLNESSFNEKPLTPSENVFYILSGFAFYRLRKKQKKEEEEKNE